MNLEELQIKIGIELKELNKQLKKASDDINDVLGPKATKKMMTDNNKVIKDGFKDMGKVAKTSAKQIRKDVTKEFDNMSKDINKSLNKAFDIDMRKFNSNLNQSMNDAKSTVKSACNDIRRELNAALNVKANIKVNASASASGSNAASRHTETAAIIQSSQYTGAMITKAVNEMIKTNNANTARIESTIKHIESALVSEFSKLSAKMQASNDKIKTTDSKKGKSSSEHKLDIKANVETSLKVVEEDLQGEVDKAINSVKADLETNIKLNADELQNDANKAIREVTTRDIEASIKVNEGHLQDEVDSVVDRIDVPEISAIIELDENLQNEVNRAVREVNVPELNTTLELEHNLQDDVNDAVRKVDVPELNTSIEIEGDLQNEVNKAIREVDVPELKAAIELEEDLQSEINSIVNSITVPNLKTTLELEQDLQTEVNRIIEGTELKKLKTSIEIDEKELQLEANLTAKHVKVPKLTTNIEVGSEGLQEQVNSIVKTIKAPKILTGLDVKLQTPDSKDNNSKPNIFQSKGIANNQATNPKKQSYSPQEVWDDVFFVENKMSDLAHTISILTTSFGLLTQPVKIIVGELGKVSLESAIKKASENSPWTDMFEKQAVSDSIKDLEYKKSKFTSRKSQVQSGLLTDNIENAPAFIKALNIEIEKLNKEIQEQTKLYNKLNSQKGLGTNTDSVKEQIKASQEAFNKAQIPTVSKPNQPVQKKQDTKVLTQDSSKKTPKPLNVYSKIAEGIKEQLSEIFRGLKMMEGEPDTDELDAYYDSLVKINEQLRKLKIGKVENPEIQKAIKDLIHYKDIAKQLERYVDSAKIKSSKNTNEIDLEALERRTLDPNKPDIGESDNNSLGFMANYKKGFDDLVNLAKKAGSKIKKALSDSTDDFLAITVEDNDPKKLNRGSQGTNRSYGYNRHDSSFNQPSQTTYFASQGKKPLGIKDNTINTMDKAFKALDKSIKTFDAIIRDFDKSVKEFKACVDRLAERDAKQNLELQIDSLEGYLEDFRNNLGGLSSNEDFYNAFKKLDIMRKGIEGITGEENKFDFEMGEEKEFNAWADSAQERIDDVIKRIKALSNEEVDLDIDTQIDNASKQLEDIRKRAKSLLGEEVDLDLDEQIDNANKQLEELRKRVKSLSGEEVDLDIDTQIDNADKQLEELREKIKKSIPDIKSHLKDSLKGFPDELAMTIDDDDDSFRKYMEKVKKEVEANPIPIKVDVNKFLKDIKELKSINNKNASKIEKTNKVNKPDGIAKPNKIVKPNETSKPKPPKKKDKETSPNLPILYSDALNEPFEVINREISNLYNEIQRIIKQLNELKQVKEIENFFKSIQPFVKGVYQEADRFNGVLKDSYDTLVKMGQVPIDEKLSKAKETTEKLDDSIISMANANTYGIGPDADQARFIETTEENISKIFETLGKPCAFFPGAFKEAAQLNAIIKEITGVEPGADILNEKKHKEAQEIIKETYSSLKHLSSEEFKLKVGSLDEFKIALETLRKSTVRMKEDFNSSEIDVKFAKEFIDILDDVKKRIEQIEDDELEIKLKADEKFAKKASEQLFDFLKKKTDETEQAFKDLYESAIIRKHIPIDIRLEMSELGTRELQDGIEETLKSYNELKKAMDMPIKDIVIGADVESYKALKAAEEEFKEKMNKDVPKLARMDDSEFKSAISGKGFSYDEIADQLKEVRKQLEETLDDTDSLLSKDDAQFCKKALKNIKELQKKVERIQDEEIGFKTKVDDLGVNLDLDELLAKLKGIQSIDDIDIDLSELKTDLIKLADEAGELRSEIEDDEIKIKVVDDEVAKIKELLTLLSKLRGQDNIEVEVDVNVDEGDLDRITESQFQNFFDQMRLFRSIDMSQLTGLFGRNNAAMKWPFKLHMALTKFEAKALKVFRSIKTKAAPILSKVVTPLKNAFNKIYPPIKNVANKIITTFRKVKTNIKGFGSVIKYHINKAFTGIKSTKLYTSIASGLNKAKSAVSRFAGRVRPILNKAFKNINFSNISGAISKGLSRAKGTLSKFASSCKTIWGRIRSIFSKGARDASKATGGLTLGLKGLLRNLIGMFGLYRLGAIFVEGTKQAISYEASLMTIKRTLGGASKSLIDFANNNAQAFGISKSQVMGFGNIYSVIVSNFEKDATKVANTTQKLIESAGIIAGATGYNVNDVLENLRSGILGSSESVDQLGLNLKVATLEASQSFKEIGKGAKSWEDLTEAQKQAIITQEIINQTTAKYGGIVKNTASMHNAFMAQLNNTKLALGQVGKALYTAILPALTTIMAVLEKVFTYAAQAITSLLSVFGITVDFSASLGGVDNTLGDSVGDSFDDAKDSAEEAEEAVEKFKGSLMGFDEINILSDNTNKNDDNNNEDLGANTGEIVPPEITEGENPLDKFGEKIKAFMDEVLEPFKNAWDLLGDRWKTAWADLKDSFKNFCDSLARFLKSVWDNGGKEFVQHLAEIGLACGIAAMEIGGTILDALAKLWDHLDPEKNMHTQRLLDVLNEVAPKLRDFILGLNEHLENLLEYGGQDVLNAMGDCFMDLAAAAVNSFGVIIDAVDGLIDHLDPKFNQDTRNMLQAVADAFHATGQAAWDFSELLRSTLENGGQEVINAFGTFGVNLIETAARVTTTVMESFSELFDYIDPANNSNTRQALKNWEDAFYSLGDAALEFADLFESVMDNGGQEVVNKLGDAFVSLGGLVGTAVKEIGDALDGLFEHLDPATNQFTKDFLKAWERAFAGVSDMFNSFGDLLGSVMDNGGQELLNSIGDLGMKLGEAAGVIVEEVSETLSGLFEHLDPANNEHTKKMLESLDKLVDSITDFADKCIKAFQKFMDSGGREFVNNLGDILAIVIDLAAELGSGIIDIITAFMDSWVGQALIEGVATALEWVTEKLVGLSDAFDVVKDIFKNIIDIIVGIFEGDGEKVGRAFANLIKNAFKLTGELLQWLWDIGCDIVAGLVKGICALPKVLWEAVKFIFDTIVGFFKELFGIHSPSTVFAELGGFLIEGLVEGITGLISSVTDAFNKIGDAITGAIEGIIKNGVEKFKEIKDGIVEKCKETKEAVSEKWKEIKTTVSDKCKEIYDDTKEKWKNVYETVSEKAKDTYETAKENWKNIYEAVSEKTKETYESIKENWKEIKQTATDIFSETYNTTKEKWKNIKDTVSEKAKETYESAKDRWSDLKQNTTDRFKEAYETVRDKFGNIRDTVKDKASQAYEDASASWTKIKDDAASKLEQIKTDAEKRYNDVKEILVKKIGEAKDGIVKKWEEVRTATNECVENVRQTAEEKYNEIKETIKSRLEDVKNETSKKWEEIKNNTSTSVENIRKEADEKYTKIKESFLEILETTKTAMATKWDNIKSDAISTASKMTEEATTKFAEIKTKFTSKLDEVKTALGPKWDALKTQASTKASEIAQKSESVFSNMGSKASSALDSARTTISSGLSKIGSLFSSVKWSLPSIKLPHFSISGGFSLNPPKVPTFSVKWYKRGGIIDGMTPLGMTGGTMHMGGEAGKEMVVPLENTSFTSKIAQAMGQAVDNALARSNNRTNNSDNPYINDNRDVVLQVDGREFARASINSINKLQRESGRTLLDI